MSTNSKIAIVNDDGTVSAIRCHWDGYLDHCGRILDEHYTDVEKVRELISLGSLSSIGPKIGVEYDEPALRDRLLHASTGMKARNELHEFTRSQCTFYMRDMKRSGYEAEEYRSLSEFYANGESYNYVFVKGEWWCDALAEDRDMTSPWATVKEALEYDYS